MSPALAKVAWSHPFLPSGVLACDQEVVSGVHPSVCLCESDLPLE